MKLAQPIGTTPYDVKSSDTISSIALRFNTTPTVLSRLNHLSSSLLFPGQTLFVPDKSAVITKDASSHHKPISTEPLPSNSINIYNKKNKRPISPDLSLSPDHSLERLLDDEHLHHSPDEISRRYLKISAKYVTDGQGVVAGILLITPQTLMFNPNVSDHLVMDRGQEKYIVRAPLKSIASVMFYDDIAAMVVGDCKKRCLPTSSFIDYEQTVSPKPGVVICQETGEKYTLFTPEHSSEENIKNNKKDIENFRMPDESCDTIKSISKDQGISTMSESSTCESTLKDENVVSDNDLKNHENSSTEPERVSLFMQETKQSSTPKHSHQVDSYKVVHQTEIHNELDINRDSKNISVLDNTENSLKTFEPSIDNSSTSSSPITKNDPHSTFHIDKDIDKLKDPSLQNVENETSTFSSEENLCDNQLSDSNECTTQSDILQNGECTKNDNLQNKELYTETECLQNKNRLEKELVEKTELLSPNDSEVSIINSNLHNESVNNSQNENLSSVEPQITSPVNDCSKDSGISEYTNSSIHHDHSHDKVVHETLTQRSSLSNEARQWLGKRGIHLKSMEEEDQNEISLSSTDDISSDVTPRPAKKTVDPLMYTAVKIHKSYWLPSRTTHNAIMGIPPNRDQKRRQHWFAIPKARVDQLNNFLLHWAPDVNSNSSGLSTPASGLSTPDNLLERSGDEGINFVDDAFHTSPATSFGYEKVHQDDAIGLKVHQYSSASSSLRSLVDDDPELLAESALLTRKQLGQLSRKLPSRTVGHSWELVYSTTLHGISLSTLYRNFTDYDNPSLIIAKDEHDRVFGAFMSEPPKLSDSFYGTGESLLFTFSKENKVKIYQWSGENNFFIKGSKTSLSVGGGDGVFGLWFDEDLYRGRSHSCRTFDNETLSEKEDFICTGLEAWAFV